MATTDTQAPIYTENRVSGRDIVVYAGGTDSDHTSEETANVTVECFRVPKTVNWAYVVVNNKALNNNTLTVDFELHKSETDTIVNRILALAGIVLNKVGLAQTAATAYANETQTQNQ